METEEFERVMFYGVNPHDPYNKITALLAIFVIEVLDKEKIPILRKNVLTNGSFTASNFNS